MLENEKDRKRERGRETAVNCRGEKQHSEHMTRTFHTKYAQRHKTENGTGEEDIKQGERERVLSNGSSQRTCDHLD